MVQNSSATKTHKTGQMHKAWRRSFNAWQWLSWNHVYNSAVFTQNLTVSFCFLISAVLDFNDKCKDRNKKIISGFWNLTDFIKWEELHFLTKTIIDQFQSKPENREQQSELQQNWPSSPVFQTHSGIFPFTRVPLLKASVGLSRRLQASKLLEQNAPTGDSAP